MSIFAGGDVALVFTARWDGNSKAYARRVAEHAFAGVVDVDVDGRIGGAIAGALQVMTTPTIVSVRNGEVDGLLIGRRGYTELHEWFARRSA